MGHATEPGACTPHHTRGCAQVKLVRGNLTALERATIGALVVIDVHARDVVEEMVHEDVAVEDDFGWLSRLRWGGRRSWEEVVGCLMLKGKGGLGGQANPRLGV